MNLMTEEEFNRFIELSAKFDAAIEAAELEGKYVNDSDVFTKEEQDEFCKLNFKSIASANFDKLGDIEEEATNRVWYDRSSIGTDAEAPGISEDIRQRALKMQKKFARKYKIKRGDCTDFYHGYWSGILALCRFLGGVSDDIDDLRSGNNLLDT